MDDKLLEALKIIRAECKKYYDDCLECPLYDDGAKCCYICDSLEYPCDWQLRE